LGKLIKPINTNLIKNVFGETLQTDKKFFSKIGLNYLIYAILALAFQIVIVNIFADSNLLHNYNIFVIFSAICNYILPLPVFYYLMKKIKTYPIETSEFSARRLIYYIGITFVLMFAGNIIGLAITALLGGVLPSDVTNPVKELINSSDIWLNLVLVSIIGPVLEELFFRKLLVDRSIKYGARVSILLSALIFGFFHGNLNQFFYAFLLGGFFAYVYIQTGKITYTIALHILVNFLGSVVSVFVLNSTELLSNGLGGIYDMAFVLIYFGFMTAAIIIGLFGLSKYNRGKFNGSKTLVNLKEPLKTIIINPGMLAFIAFFIIEIIIQAI